MRNWFLVISAGCTNSNDTNQSRIQAPGTWHDHSFHPAHPSFLTPSILTFGTTPHRKLLHWFVVSTPLKNISQNGNLPQIGVNTKKMKPQPSSQLNPAKQLASNSQLSLETNISCLGKRRPFWLACETKSLQLSTTYSLASDKNRGDLRYPNVAVNRVHLIFSRLIDHDSWLYSKSFLRKLFKPSAIYSRLRRFKVFGLQNSHQPARPLLIPKASVEQFPRFTADR